MMTTIGGVQYDEVKRKAEVGEKIKVVNAVSARGRYKNGDVLSVTKSDDVGVHVERVDVGILHREYIVLEPVTSADTVVHNGAQYRKVDRPVREGDAFIIPKMARFTCDLTSGKVYALGRDDDGDFMFADDDGDERTSPIEYNDVYVLEPIAPSLSALESELAATKAKVAEMEALLAEVKRVEAEVQRLKVGDYAKVTKSGSHSFKSGDLVKIYDIVNYGANRIRCEYLDGSRIGGDYFFEYELTRATDEEVAEAKRKLEEQRKQAEETAKWAAIGRKVSEFKVGDVARLINENGPAGDIFGGIAVGDIGVLYEADSDGTFRFGARGATRGNYVGTCQLELVAPVESIVNLRGGDAA